LTSDNQPFSGKQNIIPNQLFDLSSISKKHKNNQIYKDAKRDYYYVEKMTTIIRFTKCHLVRILGIWLGSHK